MAATAWARCLNSRSGTSHISVVDGEGRAVAMTTTIEAAFVPAS